MKKILSRIALALLLMTFAAIVLCFYFNQFSYAYGLIVVRVDLWCNGPAL